MGLNDGQLLGQGGSDLKYFKNSKTFVFLNGLIGSGCTVFLLWWLTLPGDGGMKIFLIRILGSIIPIIVLFLTIRSSFMLRNNEAVLGINSITFYHPFRKVSIDLKNISTIIELPGFNETNYSHHIHLNDKSIIKVKFGNEDLVNYLKARFSYKKM